MCSIAMIIIKKIFFFEQKKQNFFNTAFLLNKKTFENRYRVTVIIF